MSDRDGRPGHPEHPDRAAGRHADPRPSNAHLARRPVAAPVGAPSPHRGRRADGGDGAGHGGQGRQAQPWRPGPARPSACRSRRPLRRPGSQAGRAGRGPDDRPPGGVLAADQPLGTGPPWLGVQVEPGRLELKALRTETAPATPRRAPRAAAETRSVPVRFGLGGPRPPRSSGSRRLGNQGRGRSPTGRCWEVQPPEEDEEQAGTVRPASAPPRTRCRARPRPTAPPTPTPRPTSWTSGSIRTRSPPYPVPGDRGQHDLASDTGQVPAPRHARSVFRSTSAPTRPPPTLARTCWRRLRQPRYSRS